MSDHIQSLAQRTDELREMLGGFSTSGQMANAAAGVDADAERSLQATTNGNGDPQRDHTAGSA